MHQRTHIYFKWSNFFDPEFAKNAVQNIKSYRALDEQTDAWDEYIQWEKESADRSYQASMKALEKHPKRDGIKLAHDIQHLWEWWRYNLRPITNPAQLIKMNTSIPWNGWNNWHKIQCTWIKRTLRNPWGPDSCLIPDWRSPEMMAEDEAFLAKQAAQKKKN